ncbi:MAG: hypothetical protein J7516_17525, partial [Shinella sp.]|nr:hypothetical protein [Shinella sp.]
MKPLAAIDMLDRQLAKHGEDIVITRIVKRGGVNVAETVTCRAFVKSVSADEIAGKIMAEDLKVIISPTQILDAGWPGTDENIIAGNNVDQRIPKSSDKVTVQGRPREIRAPKPKLMNGVWVRSDMVVA